MATPLGVPLPYAGTRAAAPHHALVVPLDVDGVRREVRVVDAGLACCSLEVMAAVLGAADDAGLPDVLVEDGPAVDVLVVSGTCTDVLAPVLRRLLASLEGEPVVVAFGACASSGGPYWDSYSVTQGVDQLLPVDAYVPGCPPPPGALLAAVADVLSRRS